MVVNGCFVTLAFCWRLSHALGSFVVTSVLRWRDKRTLPWGNSLTALANEFAARFICFNWSQPFPQFALGVDPLGAKNGVPILLVHGLGCNRGNWFWFRRELERRGYRVYTVDCTPPLMD